MLLIIVHHLIIITEKTNFLALVEGPTNGINDSAGAAEKKLVLTLVNLIQNLQYNGDESYFYVSKIEIFKFKANDNISSYNFCLGSVSRDFTKDEQSETSLNDTVNDSSFGHSSTKK